jgi:hypothetical protein
VKEVTGRVGTYYGGRIEIGNATTEIAQTTLTPECVRRIVEDSEATGPVGIDPETIAAARRLWKHFNSHGCA